jgi:hypothetical protein
MAYHAGIQKLVLFGGAGPSWPPSNQTWLFDGSSWAKGPAAPAGLGGRSGAQMVYDPDIGKIVLFGGSGMWPYADTWLFDGSTWKRGPATPAGMSARAFFAMAYDPRMQRVVLAGGNGGTDVWYFDGSAWTQGPAPLPEARERFRMDYNPQLDGVVMFGGIGPGIGSSDMWLLRNGAWTRTERSRQQPEWPKERRIHGAVVWNPRVDALMLFAGVRDDFESGTNGFKDVWFFRESPPRVTGVNVTPTAPDLTERLQMTVGPAVDGYGELTFEYAWFKDGVVLNGANQKKLTPQQGSFAQGDQFQARVRVTDQFGFAGAWVSSNTVTVGNRPPSILRATIEPGQAYVGSSLRAVAGGVADPDGDEVTLDYVWTVNGTNLAGHDAPALAPGNFTQGDQIAVTISVVDEFGTPGNAVTSPAVAIEWNLNPVVLMPGETKTVRGHGFQPGETVEVRLESSTGTRLGTVVVDTAGDFNSSFTFPAPFAGGNHVLVGVGGTSGIVGPGPLTVVPTGSIDKVNLAVGDTTTFSGMGFLPGESVSLSFPHGSTVTGTADANGSLSRSLVSPAEPFPGGKVRASGPSGTLEYSFNTVPQFTSPGQGQAGGQAPISLTGYGPSETVELRFDSEAPVATFVADSTGSLSENLVLRTTFGNHDLKARGTSSGIEKSNPITLPASMSITPTSGPVGTVVTVRSGPGWVSGETMQVKWQSEVVKTVTADANGVVNTTFTVPSHAPGVVVVRLTGTQLGITVNATFTITT